LALDRYVPRLHPGRVDIGTHDTKLTERRIRDIRTAHDRMWVAADVRVRICNPPGGSMTRVRLPKGGLATFCMWYPDAGKSQASEYDDRTAIVPLPLTSHAKAARNRLPAWAARTALAVGVLMAAFAAFLTHAVAVTAPLFAQPQDVPSVMDSAAEWSPEHIGSRKRTSRSSRSSATSSSRPIGLAPAQPLPGDRTTFYVPRSDDNPLRGSG